MIKNDKPSGYSNTEAYAPYKCQVCEKLDGNLIIFPPTIGTFIKCGRKDCKKYFHGLCAYLEGFEFTLKDSRDNTDDKSKNGLDFKVFCPEHQTDISVLKWYISLKLREIALNKSILEDFQPTSKMLLTIKRLMSFYNI
jgi:hypothetical protein